MFFFQDEMSEASSSAQVIRDEISQAKSRYQFIRATDRWTFVNLFLKRFVCPQDMIGLLR